MIRFENTEVVGWEHAIRGMRNPKNSWDKSDSKFGQVETRMSWKDWDLNLISHSGTPDIGYRDLTLMKRLVKAGTDHRKFLRMIVVYVDITAPLYWWKEFDTYKVGTVTNSCSTMHKIHAKEFTIDDFSHEHMTDGCMDVLNDVIDALNFDRDNYLETGDKQYWWNMIQLLPTSYNQKRTVMLNYEVLANIYKPTSRRYHKQDEWNAACEGSFCKWIESLPQSELITGKDGDPCG